MSDWRQRAACADEEHRHLFPGSRSSVPQAKKVCNQVCPVRQDCLAYALVNGERNGVWGGMSSRERRKITKATTVR